MPHADHDYRYVYLAAITIAWWIIIYVLIILQGVRSWLITIIKQTQQEQDMRVGVVCMKGFVYNFHLKSDKSCWKNAHKSQEIFLSRYALEN